MLLAFSALSFSQDYKVTEVEHLQNDMTARKIILTERVNGGQQCAVLRISTQNIIHRQRDAFQFECDMGSVIRERRKDGGEICLWVSPGIKILKIKHSTLGNYILNIPELLHDNVQSLNTYRIHIVGLKEITQESVSQGKSCMVFLPYPEDASLFINGDSIGTGSHVISSLSGTYQWLVKHPLYHTANGTVELSKGKSDTVYVNLVPAYGYMKILDAKGIIEEGEEMNVFVDGEPKGSVPFESGKLKEGFYDITLKNGDTIKASAQIEVREHQISVSQADDLCLNYAHENNGLVSDSTYKPKQTRFYPITGSVAINSTPIANVLIDTTEYGPTPVTVPNLAVGHHELKLSATGFSSLTQAISVEEGEETPYYLKLNRLCRAAIVTDEEGDVVYVDKEYVGRTPVTIEKPFGNHLIYITRIGQFDKEFEVTLASDEPEPTLNFSFGQHYTITTGSDKGKLFLDGNPVGRIPMDLYVFNGTHTITAERGWKMGEKEIHVPDGASPQNLVIDMRTQKPKEFLQRGAFFLTGHVGLIKTGTPVYGFNIGDIAKGGQAGWFFSLTTNLDFINQLIDKDFSLLNAYRKTSEYGQQLTDIGEQSTIRASALFGVALNVVSPVYLRIAGGYGFRYYGYKFVDNGYSINPWVIVDPYSWRGFEASLGLQCCIYNIVVNADALIPVTEVLTYKKKMVEFRVGLGFCLKHKK